MICAAHALIRSTTGMNSKLSARNSKPEKQTKPFLNSTLRLAFSPAMAIPPDMPNTVAQKMHRAEYVSSVLMSFQQK